MPYDEIMGVGREAQITSDFASDPLGVGYDLGFLCVPKSVQEQMGVVAGSLLNPVNSFFDYVNNDAYKIERNGTALTNIFTYDLQNIVYLRALSVLYTMNGSGNTATCLIETSEDGLSFKPIENLSVTSTAVANRLVVVTAQRVKVIRFTITMAGMGGSSTFTLSRIDIKRDPNE